ncbi:hypothetical protein RQM65_16220 [Pricia sp. S334]|uniref:Uncharacterized protein n=1 Tax=Pricia mediterranea TaxID=3076079 RepID=A0ABU3L8Z9_9FLAO|nr:hypothetical protein [Pricia sp. S334]MDT7830215.1 hypothetical protein [Pricia sp. S334]
MPPLFSKGLGLSLVIATTTFFLCSLRYPALPYNLKAVRMPVYGSEFPIFLGGVDNLGLDYLDLGPCQVRNIKDWLKK